MAYDKTGGTAEVKISTTLYKSNSTSSTRLKTLKAGTKVRVMHYNHKDWFCKCYAPDGTLGYALYKINGNIHISGPGVTAAVEAHKKAGDGTKGYITTSGESITNLSGTGTVKNAVTVRKTASKVGTIVGTIPAKTIVNLTKINGNTGWCYVNNAMGLDTNKKQKKLSGYIQYKTSSTTYVKVNSLKNIKDASTLNAVNSNKKVSSVTDKTSNNNAQETIEETAEDIVSGDVSGTSTYIPESIDTYEDITHYEAFSSKYEDYTTAESFVTSLRGIYGMPYQFSKIVDPKLTSSGLYGRLYSDRILSKMPLLLMSSGIPRYMPDYSSEKPENLLEAVVYKGIDNLTDFFQELSDEKGDGRFYTFQHEWEDYYKFVNTMLRHMAIYLGIGDVLVPTGNSGYCSLETMEWANYQSSYLGDVSGAPRAVGFYVDSESQMSESFNNATSKSQFADAVNGVNDLSREIGFLMGGATGTSFNELIDNNFDDAYQQIQNFMNKYQQVLPGLLISRLKNTMQTIKVGGQLVFPEIWNDSDFSRSYDINIKLRTPDGDNLSWYMNIAVPMMHLLGFVLPRQLGYNGIQSPFLVRAYYKGFFNVNMGIITSMNISRGDKSKWNLQGLPLDVDISFSIKDLYQSLSMTPSDDIVGLSKNVDELDYLANLCGINVNKPDIMRAIELNLNNFKNIGLDNITFNRGFLGVSQFIDNTQIKIYEKLCR